MLAYTQNSKKFDARRERGVFVAMMGRARLVLCISRTKNVVRRVRFVRFTDKYEAELPKSVTTVPYECDSESEVDSDMTYLTKPQEHKPIEEHSDQTKYKSPCNKKTSEEGSVRKNSQSEKTTQLSKGVCCGKM